tara:strand:+ start:266 stop:769 length:504 start_codon:yes stop_codon:yes gene_type:complete
VKKIFFALSCLLIVGCNTTDKPAKPKEPVTNITKEEDIQELEPQHNEKITSSPSQPIFKLGGEGSRDTEPYLIGAEGWLTEFYDGQFKSKQYISSWGLEKSKRVLNKRIKIVGQDLKHKGWGRYGGLLRVVVLETNDTLIIEDNQYSPDYEFGRWKVKKETKNPNIN